MEANDIYCTIYDLAKTMNIIELEIKPGDILAAERGLKYWIEEGVTVEKKTYNGRQEVEGAFAKLLNRDKHKPDGRSPLVNYFKNSGKKKKRLALGVPELREILPINISENDGDFFCNKNAFACALGDIKISIVRKSQGFDLREHVFAKRGFILMRLRGKGRIFFHTGGQCTKNFLKNQVLQIDRRLIVAFTSRIRCDDESSGILKSLKPVLDDSYETTLRGTGTVYLQSKPYIQQQSSNWLICELWKFMDPKSLQPCIKDLQKITSLQWSKFRNLLKIN